MYASNYDLGGHGIGYSDSIWANPNEYRADGDDIKTSSDTSAGTGYVLGWRTAGEWTKYTVTSLAGTYKLTARIESAATLGRFTSALMA